MTATLAMTRLIAPLAVFVAVLAVMVALNGGATSPPAPPAGADVGRPSGDPLRDARSAVGAAPDSADARAQLGEAYVTKARASGDPSLYARAERVLSGALRRDPGNVAALVGAGTLAGLRHDFRGQLRLGLAARRVAPALARPYTVIADAQIELGRYRDAARSIQRLVDLKPGLPAYARASYYRELTGDPAGAVRAMRFAVSAGGSPESLAYVQALTGNLELVRGRPEAAWHAYMASLRTVPGYSDALEGLARVDAARGDLRRSAARVRRLAADRPPARALTFLAELELASGHPRAARLHLRTARAQFARDRAGGATGPTRMAREAQHPLRRCARLGPHSSGASARGAHMGPPGAQDRLTRSHVSPPRGRGGASGEAGARSRAAFRDSDEGRGGAGAVGRAAPSELDPMTLAAFAPYIGANAASVATAAPTAGALAPGLVRPQRQREDQQRADRHHAHLAERDPLRQRHLLRPLERLDVLDTLELALRDAYTHPLAQQRDDERRDAVRHVQAIGRGGAAGEEQEAEDRLHHHRRLGQPEQRPEHDRGARVLAQPADHTPPRGHQVRHQHGDPDHHVNVAQRVSFRTM